MDTTATLQFEAVAVTSHSDLKKGFSNLSIEVTKKEIYIGSRYKIKWKNVEDVHIFDAEDYHAIGFSLRCLFLNKNNKTKKTEDDRDEKEESRLFEVFCPVPPFGSRDFVSAWKIFHRTLTHCYENEHKKRTKKQERLEVERQQRSSNENNVSQQRNSTMNNGVHPSQGTTAIHSSGRGSGSSRLNGNWQTERDTPHRREMIQYM